MPLSNLDLFLQSPTQWPAFNNYTPLDQSRREIRLLDLSQSENGDIHLHIRHVSLIEGEKTPEYEALSYCWGPPDELKPVFVDGEAVFFRATVYHFLRELCGHGQQLPIWLDIISINQHDSAERSWQVSMMGDIYKSATCVRTWLGQLDADASFALGYCQFYNQIVLQESEHLHNVRKCAIQSLRQLVKRPYWERVWIVQEVCLAKEITVMCGNIRLAWSDMIDTISSLAAKIIYAEEVLTLNALREENRLRGKEFGSQNPDYETSLLKVALSFASRSCQDPRDKIFGFCSLVSQTQRIQVDYDMPLVEPVLDIMINRLVSEEIRRLRWNRSFRVHPRSFIRADLMNTLTDVVSFLESVDVTFAELLPQVSQSRGQLDSSLILNLQPECDNRPLQYLTRVVGYSIEWAWIFPFKWSWYETNHEHEQRDHQGSRTWQDRRQYAWAAMEEHELPIIGDIFIDFADKCFIVLRHSDTGLRVLGVIYERNHPKHLITIPIVAAIMLGHIQICQKVFCHADSPASFLFHFSRIGILVVTNLYVNDESSHAARFRAELVLWLMLSRHRQLDRSLCRCNVPVGVSELIRRFRAYRDNVISNDFDQENICKLEAYYCFHHYSPGIDAIMRQCTTSHDLRYLDSEAHRSLCDQLLAEADLETRKQLILDHYYPNQQLKVKELEPVAEYDDPELAQMKELWSKGQFDIDLKDSTEQEHIQSWGQTQDME